MKFLIVGYFKLDSSTRSIFLSRRQFHNYIELRLCALIKTGKCRDLLLLFAPTFFNLCLIHILGNECMRLINQLVVVEVVEHVIIYRYLHYIGSNQRDYECTVRPSARRKDQAQCPGRHQGSRQYPVDAARLAGLCTTVGRVPGGIGETQNLSFDVERDKLSFELHSCRTSCA